MELVTDPDDERIADYRALTDVALRTRWEQPHGVFIAEGELVLRRALRAGYRPRSYLLDATRADAVGELPDAPVYVASREMLERATGFRLHRDVLGSFHRRPLADPDALVATARRLVVCEDVNNHTNLGAIFRSVAGLGMDGVLLSPTCTDPLYRRAIRVSMGEVFTIPYARVGELPQALEPLRRAGYSLLALTPEAGAVPLQQLAWAHRARPALLLGAEATGLSEETVAATDVPVSIPMQRGVDSLNVAAAAAVACWELNRS